MSRKKSFTLDNDSFASNPGNVGVNVFVWAKHKPLIVGLLAFAVLFSLFRVYTYSRWCLLETGAALVASTWYWTRVKEHFAFGCANPGIVVSIHPPLVAVSTDVTKGVGYYPVIKIIPHSGGDDARLGERVGTVALYGDANEHHAYWSDFNPISIEYATSDALVHKRVLDSYSDEDWAALNRGVKDLRKPYRPGLYRVERDSSDWPS
ncbi:MAG: DUF3239 domain-containing protein [Kofleriaceae bacterium]|nr:DUF3239 domain-containing protein [Kofleriaceae bacterium]